MPSLSDFRTTKKSGQSRPRIGGGQRGIVISIASKLPRQQERTQKLEGPPISQDRLAHGFELYLEEVRITRALREFRLQLEADLTAGSTVEPGEFLFDSELKIVRRNVPSAIAKQ